MPIQVLPSFELPAGTTKAFFRNNYYQAADDLTLIRGRHQFGVGGSVAYFNGFYQSSSRAAGIWIFDGSASGWASPICCSAASPPSSTALQNLPVHGWYVGFYGQDTWRATERVTFNLGLRWEPYLGTSVESGAVYASTTTTSSAASRAGVRERARGHALSRRRWISVRTDRAEQAVDELLAQGWGGVGPDG